MKSSARKQWDQYEDECLVEAVSEVGIADWSIVAACLAEKFGIKERSGKKCRERWINHLKPEVSKSVWSENEANILFKYHSYHGNQWTEIAKFLPGRTDNSVKNFFYSTLRKKLRWYNKTRSPSEQIKMTANELSLNPLLAKVVLESCDNKPVNNLQSPRKSARLNHFNIPLVEESQKLPKVVLNIDTRLKQIENAYDFLKETYYFDFSVYAIHEPSENIH